MQVGNSHGSVNSADSKKMFSDICKDFAGKWNIKIVSSFDKT